MADIEQLRQRFLRVEVGHVADALDHETIINFVLPLGLRPMTQTVRMAGPASTLKLALSRTAREPRRLSEFKNAVTPGSVAVIDVQGICDPVVLGDRAALGLVQNGAAGVVVNGGVRDVEGLSKLDLPVFALSTGMRASEARLQGVGINVEVILGGIFIAPGDWLVGDASGICVIPQDIVERVCELAEERDEIDKESLKDIRAGKDLSDMHRHFHDDDVPALRAIE